VNNVDDWGIDPSVQYMRQVFSRMEIVQKNLIEKLEISSFDTRLRNIRENAKLLFEGVWYKADREKLDLRDDDTPEKIYSYCLAWYLNNVGIEVPENFLPNDKRISTIIKEVL
jgi:hypothetical protein